MSGSPVSGTGVIDAGWTNAEVNGSHVIVLQDQGTNCPNGTTPISRNESGPPGPDGTLRPVRTKRAGGGERTLGTLRTGWPPGTNGSPGAGAVVADSAPSPPCANGGITVTDGSGHIGYVCNGADGSPGPSGPAGPAGTGSALPAPQQANGLDTTLSAAGGTGLNGMSVTVSPSTPTGYLLIATVASDVEAETSNPAADVVCSINENSSLLQNSAAATSAGMPVATVPIDAVAHNVSGSTTFTVSCSRPGEKSCSQPRRARHLRLTGARPGDPAAHHILGAAGSRMAMHRAGGPAPRYPVISATCCAARLPRPTGRSRPRRPRPGCSSARRPAPGPRRGRLVIPDQQAGHLGQQPEPVIPPGQDLAQLGGRGGGLDLGRLMPAGVGGLRYYGSCSSL
jgi:hypothetical protein